MRVRDESHLEDMRAAIRGDFERLEQRRGEQELMRPVPPRPERSEPPEEPAEPEDVPAAVAPVAAVEVEPPPEPAPEETPVADEPEEEPPRRRSWLDRLLGRP